MAKLRFPYRHTSMEPTARCINSPCYFCAQFIWALLIRSPQQQAQSLFEHSYWEFKPCSNVSISFIRLGSGGLKLFRKSTKKIGQILIVFKSSHQAIKNFCDLPFPCGISGIYTRINSTCLYLPRKQEGHGEFCDGSFNSEMEMVELEGVNKILRMPSPMTNSTKDECASSCLEDCLCAAALYTKQECFQYGLVAGVREVGSGAECSYWVKVIKDTGGRHGISTSLMKKILLLGEIVNVVAICCIVRGILYWPVLKIRQKTREHSGTDN